MITTIHPDNPDPRSVAKVTEILTKGGVVIIPTDTVYAIACDPRHHDAYEKMCRIVGVKPNKAMFSFLFGGLEEISNYTRPFSRSVFRLLKSSIPGPYTFILETSSRVPSVFKAKRKTIGYRVPANNIVQSLIHELDGPLVTTSLHQDGGYDDEYMTDPFEINEKWGNVVDVVVDGGYGGQIASTVIDCSVDPPELIREGAGAIEGLL